MEVQRQISLRSREVPVTRNKEAKHKSSTRKPKNIPPPKDTSKDVIGPKGKIGRRIIQDAQMMGRPLSV